MSGVDLVGALEVLDVGGEGLGREHGGEAGEGELGGDEEGGGGEGDGGGGGDVAALHAQGPGERGADEEGEDGEGGGEAEGGEAMVVRSKRCESERVLAATLRWARRAPMSGL